jgi:hypothetical protein
MFSSLFFCMVCNALVLFFSFLSLTHISTHLCIASPPSLFSTSNRVRSPSDRSQAAPEQQRLDDAIGFLRDHAEVIARVAFYLFILRTEFSTCSVDLGSVSLVDWVETLCRGDFREDLWELL